jgi:hypothetical protein
MEFCLFYQGELPSNGNKRDKHRIRQDFAPQLMKLWQQEPLAGLWQKRQEDGAAPNTLIKLIDSSAFVPLVTSELHLHAALSIDLVRPGAPGSLVQAGDIDNRLKTLFDALRMPNETNELVSGEDDPHEPLHCLLEDDRLITRVDVASHQLLIDDGVNDVILLIHVAVKSTQRTWENIGK